MGRRPGERQGSWLRTRGTVARAWAARSPGEHVTHRHSPRLYSQHLTRRAGRKAITDPPKHPFAFPFIYFDLRRRT